MSVYGKMGCDGTISAKDSSHILFVKTHSHKPPIINHTHAFNPVKPAGLAFPLISYIFLVNCQKSQPI